MGNATSSSGSISEYVRSYCHVGALAVLTLTFGTFVACDRAETTSSAPVTTTSPAGTSTAPSAAAADKRDEALVRVVHAIPAGAPVDIYAGDLTVFDNLSYKSVTAYRALDGKRYGLRSVRRAWRTPSRCHRIPKHWMMAGTTRCLRCRATEAPRTCAWCRT